MQPKRNPATTENLRPLVERANAAANEPNPVERAYNALAELRGFTMGHQCDLSVVAHDLNKVLAWVLGMPHRAPRMDVLNGLLDGHGLASHSGVWYVNMGDLYTLTVIEDPRTNALSVGSVTQGAKTMPSIYPDHDDQHALALAKYLAKSGDLGDFRHLTIREEGRSYSLDGANSREYYVFEDNTEEEACYFSEMKLEHAYTLLEELVDEYFHPFIRVEDVASEVEDAAVAPSGGYAVTYRGKNYTIYWN